MAFSIVELEQGTGDWLVWRSGGIGASDAPAIMGENPWKSAKRLLREKLTPVRTYGSARGWGGNSAMARGTALEPQARDHYVTLTAHRMVPACLQSNRHDWLRASLDGIDIARGKVVEIKCGEKAHLLTARDRAVPRYYYGQLQHILAVTGYDCIDFWCWLPDRAPEHLVVPRDNAYIDRLLDTEARFWSDVLAG